MSELIQSTAVVRRESTSALSPLFDVPTFSHLVNIADALLGAAVVPDSLVTKPEYMGENKKLSALDRKRIIEALGADEVARQDEVARRGTRGTLIAVLAFCQRNDLDPLAAMPCAYMPGGKLAWEGKLVAALINAKAGLEERLNYSFTGQGDGLTVTVSGRFRGEEQARTVTLTVGKAKTANQMWQKDPEQKAIYSAVVKWARRHCPEILLGISVVEELDEGGEEPVNATVLPPVSPLAARIREGAGAILPSPAPAPAPVAAAPVEDVVDVQPEPEQEPDPFGEQLPPAEPTDLNEQQVAWVYKQAAALGLPIERVGEAMGQVQPDQDVADPTTWYLRGHGGEKLSRALLAVQVKSAITELKAELEAGAA